MKKIFVFLMLFLAFSCVDTQSKQHLPRSTGRLNSILMVIDPELWKTNVGDSLRAKFARVLEGIPGDPEPIFTIMQVPPQVFSDGIRHSRNIMMISAEGSKKFLMKDSLYAKPQKVVYMSGKTTDELIIEIESKYSQIIEAFHGGEIREAQWRMREKSKISQEIKSAFELSILLPEEYPIVKEEENFFWAEKRIKGGSANIVLYTLPLLSKYEDVSMLPKEIIHLRDSIGERYIPGPSEGMYMMTESEYLPIIKPSEVGGLPAMEGKGLWIMKDFMLGGPYIQYLIKDEKRHRYIVAEGFVVAPGVPKRDLLFEMEAIIKTINIE